MITATCNIIAALFYVCSIIWTGAGLHVQDAFLDKIQLVPAQICSVTRDSRGIEEFSRAKSWVRILQFSTDTEPSVIFSSKFITGFHWIRQLNSKVMESGSCVIRQGQCSPPSCIGGRKPFEIILPRPGAKMREDSKRSSFPQQDKLSNLRNLMKQKGNWKVKFETFCLGMCVENYTGQI
jgi:hypothetical protein